MHDASIAVDRQNAYTFTRYRQPPMTDLTQVTVCNMPGNSTNASKEVGELKGKPVLYHSFVIRKDTKVPSPSALAESYANPPKEFRNGGSSSNRF